MLTDTYVRKEKSSDKRRKIKETLYYLEHHFGNLDNMVLEVNKHAANDIEFYLDHKNEIRHDDSVENLRWATYQQNTEYHHQNNDSAWSGDHEQ